MATEIAIVADGKEFRAELNDAATARAIAEHLPFDARASRWGGEIYFSIPVAADLESGARETLDPGELAYWPPGRAFCIFFGPTPASEGDEPRAASRVNIVGRIQGGLDGLCDVPEGAKISVRPASPTP